MYMKKKKTHTKPSALNAIILLNLLIERRVKRANEYELIS